MKITFSTSCDKIINFYFYCRLNNLNGVVFQVVKNIDMPNTIMLDARLRNVLAKESVKFESFLVKENEMRPKRFDLLLLRSTVDQSWIVTKGNGEKILLAF